MGAVITVLFSPAEGSVQEFDRLLSDLGALIREVRPNGMESMSILRTDRGAVIVQARWRSAADQRAFRASPAGSRIFRAMSDCCPEPAQTYVGTEDAALSYYGAKQPNH
jgi:heme-degrading monooxygenase HmoA